MKRDCLLEELAFGVHFMLMTLHLLGVTYNLKRRNWKDVAAHAGGAAYDAWAASKHLKCLASTRTHAKVDVVL